MQHTLAELLGRSRAVLSSLKQACEDRQRRALGFPSTKQSSRSGQQAAERARENLSTHPARKRRTGCRWRADNAFSRPLKQVQGRQSRGYLSPPNIRTRRGVGGSPQWCVSTNQRLKSIFRFHNLRQRSDINHWGDFQSLRIGQNSLPTPERTFMKTFHPEEKKKISGGPTEERTVFALTLYLIIINVNNCFLLK